MVLEIPPADDGGSITGSIDDAWQTALEDVGPAGVDKGKGGKYLILPPGYKEKAPDGYIALPSHTYQRLCAAALQPQERQRCRHRQGRRLRQAHQVLSAVAGRQSAGRRHSSMRSTSCSTAPFPTTCGSFEALDRFVQSEPWLERDKVDDRSAEDRSASRRAKPFKPDAKTQEHPRRRRPRSAGLARACSYEAVFRRRSTRAGTGHFRRCRSSSEDMQTNFANPNAYPVDGRGVTTTRWRSSAPSIWERVSST